VTRRDRAAMAWALCLARRGDYMEAIAVLMRGPRDVADAAFAACRDTTPSDLRARLALYLRARLRADAGDYGRVTGRVCNRCCAFLPRKPAPNQSHYVSAHVAGCGPVFSTRSCRRITPLWEQAAQWWATHERPARGGR